MALRVISVRRAFSLLIKRDDELHPVAEVIGLDAGRYVSYTFSDWIELSYLERRAPRNGHDWVRTVRFDLMVPRVIRVLTFSRPLRQEVKFTRRNIFARDGNTCQYCGRRFSTAELSLDHVVPRARGGGTTWENVVCACIRCNVRKGGRTPREAGMNLMTEPARPRRNPLLSVNLSDHRYSVWRGFLESAHWNIDTC